MKANSSASCWLSIRCDGPKMLKGGAVRRLSCAPKYARASVQQKSSPGDFREKTSQRGKPELRSRRGFSGRFGCSASRRGCGRFRSRSRTGCFSCRWRTRGCWSCRGFGCLGLLLARRKERGTGQNADVFFHSVNWKRHIALTD